MPRGIQNQKPDLKLPTPINHKILSVYLKDYDMDAKEYLLNGFRQGFSVNSFLQQTSVYAHNLPSAYEHPEVVSEKIATEL